MRRRLLGPATTVVAVLVALAGATALSACGSGAAQPGSGAAQPESGAGGRVLTVFAAENTWGSIVRQLGGTHVHVTSVVTDPNADPHEYESNSSDARLAASADYAVLNGAGYDDWAQRLLSANPSASRRTLVISQLVGRGPADDPHLWYSPAYVERAIDRITADLVSLDPGDRADLVADHARVVGDFAPYSGLIATIRNADHGAKIGATEDVFSYMADALGLDLVSPVAFMRAVSEGNDPPVASVRAFQSELRAGQIRALVYNTQTVTPLTAGLRHMTSGAGIPVVGVSETVQPPGARFEDWQVGQLRALQSALGAGPEATT